MDVRFGSSGDLLADRRFVYALAAKDEGDAATAEDLLRQTLEIVPAWPAALVAHGETLEALGRSDEARDAYARALAVDAADRLGAGVRLARLDGDARAGAMSPAYVATLFDQYAPRFETQLVETLGYRGPDLLVDAVRRAAARKARAPHFSACLDLGCGTGLAARAFLDVTTVRYGVDLSSAMAAAARRTGLYAEVTVGDIGERLRACADRSVDLIVAADVFVYVADLRPVFRAAKRALRDDGLMAFTVQDHDNEGVALGEDLRYAHGRGHVAGLATAAGLTVLIDEAQSTRSEKGVPVPGRVFVLGG